MHGLGILDCLLVVKEVPNVFVETSGIPETGTESLIERIVLDVSAERVVFGTNSPINHPEMELERVHVAAVPDAARAQILGPNLARLLEA
jgi:predicted TIM-barrel fold metal-dependent hydrolase